MNNETATLFQRLTRGAYVIGVAHEDRREIFAAASVMQASHRPLLLAIGVDPRHTAYPLMRAGRIFVVSVLKQDQFEAVRRFGSQTASDSLPWHCGRSGVPIVDDALAYFECEMSAVMPSGDREIIVGRVMDCRIPDARGTALPHANAVIPDRRAGLPAQQFQL